MFTEIRAQFFPMSLPGDITGQWVVRSEVVGEIRGLASQIFGGHMPNLFQMPPEREANSERLRQSHAPSNPEHILFYNEANQAVGWFYSFREEATTLFIDTVGFLPEYRGRGLYTAFLRQYIAYATALGFERLTTNHHPNNRAIMIAELKAGFNVVGLELHESAGPLIKMAYFMHPDRQAGFEKVFNMVPGQTRSER